MRVLKTQRALVPGRTLRVAALVSLAGLTGCTTTRIVSKTVVAPQVMDATLDQLKTTMQQRYEAVQTINASVNVTATTGGARKGKVTQLQTLAGYIFLRKPADLRVLLLAPVIRSRAVDMVTDGKTFKLLITLPHTRAVTGPETMTEPSKNGLENLRPGIIRNAMLVPAVGPDEYVTLTQDMRRLPSEKGRKETVVEPDYDVTVLHAKADHVLERERVVHIGRATLLPYRMDLYDDHGRVVTTVEYDRYQKVDGVDYPMSILITRPLDEYTLQLDVTRLALNGKLDDEQFALKLPEGIPVQKM